MKQAGLMDGYHEKLCLTYEGSQKINEMNYKTDPLGGLIDYVAEGSGKIKKNKKFLNEFLYISSTLNESQRAVFLYRHEKKLTKILKIFIMCVY